jgi:hypothetical protein
MTHRGKCSVAGLRRAIESAAGEPTVGRCRCFARRLTPTPQSCALNEPQGVRRHARERGIGLLVAAIAPVFASARSAGALNGHDAKLQLPLPGEDRTCRCQRNLNLTSATFFAR